MQACVYVHADREWVKEIKQPCYKQQAREDRVR